jgi:hypothetical protein
MAIVSAASRPNQDRVHETLAAFNEQLGTSYTILQVVDASAQRAFLVSDGREPPHVFKWISTQDVTDQVLYFGEIAQRARTPQTHTPYQQRYAYMPGIGTAYTQQYIPGIPASYPTERVVEQLLQLSEGFSGQAVPGSNDLSAGVRETVLEDAEGWHATIRRFSKDGDGLVEEFQRLVSPYDQFRGRTTDIVHGDFTHHHALVEAIRIGGDSAPAYSQRLEGVVNWETAGRGDRAFDQARLLFDAFLSWPGLGHPPDPAAVELLTSRIAESSGIGALNMYTAYWALQVAERGVREKPEMAPLYIEAGRNVLNTLKQVTAANRRVASLS